MLLMGSALLLLGSACQKPSGVKPPDVAYYTCTMHPSVKKQNPNATCPICSMNLVPVKKKDVQMAQSSSQPAEAKEEKVPSEEDDQPSEFTVPVKRLQQIGVVFSTVEKRPLSKRIRLRGVVAYDKQRHWEDVARVDGYVQKLFVSSRGELVEKDAPLLTIYSPDLLTAENELILLLRGRDEARAGAEKSSLESADRLVVSAKEKLRLWNISERAIAELEASRKPQEQLTLYAPVRGVIQDIGVDQGKKVMAGDHLVDITDLSTVWVWGEFYEDEVPMVKPGLEVTITTSSYPGERFNGKIAVVDPFVSETLRTGRVRIDLQNPDLKLRPDMYVDVELTIAGGEQLALPVSAVLPTGTRNVVFLDKGNGRLEPRFIELGRTYGDFYQVKSGVSEGDRVVTGANFLIDAEAKVQGALKSW
jgi:Cu(I)/Ag(I) efflux system membrane fusion protein